MTQPSTVFIMKKPTATGIIMHILVPVENLQLILLSVEYWNQSAWPPKMVVGNEFTIHCRPFVGMFGLLTQCLCYGEKNVMYQRHPPQLSRLGRRQDGEACWNLGPHWGLSLSRGIKDTIEGCEKTHSDLTQNHCSTNSWCVWIVQYFCILYSPCLLFVFLRA